MRYKLRLDVQFEPRSHKEYEQEPDQSTTVLSDLSADAFKLRHAEHEPCLKPNTPNREPNIELFNHGGASTHGLHGSSGTRVCDNSKIVHELVPGIRTVQSWRCNVSSELVLGYPTTQTNAELSHFFCCCFSFFFFCFSLFVRVWAHFVRCCVACDEPRTASPPKRAQVYCGCQPGPTRVTHPSRQDDGRIRAPALCLRDCLWSKSCLW